MKEHAQQTHSNTKSPYIVVHTPTWHRIEADKFNPSICKRHDKLCFLNLMIDIIKSVPKWNQFFAMIIRLVLIRLTDINITIKQILQLPLQAANI